MRIAKIILEMLFWMLAAGVLLFGIGVAVGIVIAPALGYIAAILMLGTLPLIVRVVQTLRRRRANAAIAYLEQAVRLNLPLARMLYAAQRGERGMLGMRLAALRQLLEDGYPIGAALEVAVPEVGEREAALIEASERIGRLPQALHAIVAEQSADAARRQANDITFYRTYPFVMAVMISSVLAMVMIFVMPKFETIFRDFGTQLPQITVYTLDVARVAGPLVLAGVAAAVLVWTGLSLWQMFRPVRFTTIVGRGVRDRVAWATPVAHGVARDRGLADAFGLIAGALDNGAPIERAFVEAANLDINRVLQERFERWAQAMMAGASLADAARAAPMPPLVVGMLASAHGPDAARDVFRFLARYYHTRYSRTAALAHGAAVPVVVFFFAILVTCVALALFMPLVTLIDTMVPAMERL
jgi:type II secretory pathway component PulF